MDEVKPYWIRPTERSAEYRIISNPVFWTFHFDIQLKKKRKCGGRACYLCAIGAGKQVAAVVMCVDSAGRDCLLEMRARHREAFEQYDVMVGLRIKVRKTGSAGNSPIEIKPLDYAAAAERDISRLVEMFGEPAILVSDSDHDAGTSGLTRRLDLDSKPV